MAPLLNGATRGDGRKYFQAVLAAEQLVRRILGVGHQAEDVPRLIANTGNILERSVGIRTRGRLAFAVNVTQQDLAILSDPFKRSGIGEVTALAVLHGHSENLPFGHFTGKRRIGLFDPEGNLLADKLQSGIPDQSSREQTRLAQDLKAVADSQYQTAASRKIYNAAHNRREARHGAAPEIIAVGKTAGKN
jgi:hypothetical protein